MAKLSMRRKPKTENEQQATSRPDTGSQRPVSFAPGQANQAGYNPQQQQVPQSREPDFRPVILSIRDQEWVHQRILLIYGRAGPDAPFDGQVVVDHHTNSFPSQGFPVTNSHFKALVHLVPGPNNIKFTFIPPQTISASRFTSRLTLHCLPLLQNPPIHLAVVLANDSEGRFESPPNRPNTLEEAVRKLRMTAYLWQAYTAEQMYRNFPGAPGEGGSARRSFRLEEEWANDTLSLQESDVWRMTAKVHIVRSELTVEEMKEQAATVEGKGLKGLVRDALELYGGPFKLGEGYNGPNPIVLCLLLENHWRELMTPGKIDPENKLQLGVFISRTLWSWPSCLEEAVPALQDDIQIPPSSPGTGPSNSYYGSSFEAASAGMGGMLRELGYTFGCLPEDTGSTIRNLHTFHRTFITSEGTNSRTQLQGVRPCLPVHESSWHRIDCVQFRYHPCFRLPVEAAAAPDQVMYWPCENGLIITAPTGIILVFIRVPQKSFPVSWFEYPDRPEREAFLFESDIIDRMPPDEREKEIQLEMVSAGSGRVRVDWKWVMKAGKTHIPQMSIEIFRSRMVGRRTTEGSTDSGDFIFKTRHMTSGLVNLRISHARSLYSIEFQYADGTSSTFGTPHPRSKGTDIPIDHAGGEVILGFHVRASEWIDAIKVITNRKRSAWLGHLGSDRVFEMVPPQGYEIIGMYGRHGRCCDAFGVIYTTNA